MQQPLVKILEMSSTVEKEIGVIIPEPPRTATTSSATSTTTTEQTSPLDPKDIVVIWKEFPGYQIFIFCKYNNYFVSLHSFSLDVTNSKSRWF